MARNSQPVPVDPIPDVSMTKARFWVETIRKSVEYIGIPGSFLVLTFFMGWSAMGWAAENIAIPIVSSHRLFLEHQIEMMKEQSASSRDQSKVLRGIQEILDRQSIQLNRIEAQLTTPQQKKAS